MPGYQSLLRWSLCTAFLLLLMAAAADAGVQTKILTTDLRGANPYGNLVFDSAGNLYDTAYNGGQDGFGTVFELTPGQSGKWNSILLHTFNPAAGDGANPYAGLVFDKVGNL